LRASDGARRLRLLLLSLSNYALKILIIVSLRPEVRLILTILDSVTALVLNVMLRGLESANEVAEFPKLLRR
jgi:hypothetical protein